MTATIRKIDAARHAVFGFSAGLPPEDAWYAALEKTCPKGSSCRVSDGDLVEFGYLDRQKLDAMGTAGDEGVLVGVQIRSDPVWKAIEAGKVTAFELTITDGGVDVRFPKPQVTKAIGDNNMIEDGVFTISKSHPQFGLIAKCAAAVKRGELGGLTQASFEQALDAVTKAYAAETEQTFEQAYSAILETPLGGDLYSGYCAAPPAQPCVSKVCGSDGAACDKIQEAARQIRLESKTDITREKAISIALQEQPELYTEYLGEQQKAQAAQKAEYGS
jgi:hypothetical protein